jgi:F-box/WD-40 domain protein 7
VTKLKKIQWKKVFSERFRVKRNWLTGKSNVKTFYGHEGAVSCVQFDETRIVAGSALGTIKLILIILRIRILRLSF